MLKIHKYLNYGRSANGSTIGYACEHCHDSKELSFFGVPRNFKRYSGEYARVTSPDKLVVKDKANIGLLVDE